MEFKTVLIIMCVYFISSMFVDCAPIPSDECHVFDRNAPQPQDRNGPVRIFSVDVTPIPLFPGFKMTIKFKGFRENKQIGTSPSENVRVHMTLFWKETQVSKPLQGEIKPSQYANDYPVFCNHITSPNCPIKTNGVFSASLDLHVPNDVLLSDMHVKIELKTNRNVLLGCYLAQVQHAVNIGRP